MDFFFPPKPGGKIWFFFFFPENSSPALDYLLPAPSWSWPGLALPHRELTPQATWLLAGLSPQRLNRRSEGRRKAQPERSYPSHSAQVAPLERTTPTLWLQLTLGKPTVLPALTSWLHRALSLQPRCCLSGPCWLPGSPTTYATSTLHPFYFKYPSPFLCIP